MSSSRDVFVERRAEPDADVGGEHWVAAVLELVPQRAINRVGVEVPLPVRAPLRFVVLLDHRQQLADVRRDRRHEGVVRLGVVRERREQLDQHAGRDA
eukprot:155835-Rhodomonas_salina.4